VEKIRTTAHPPQGNGCCERFNRTLHGLLLTLDERAKKKWLEHIAALVAHYNATPHATTGYSPFHLVFGREPKLPQDQISSSTEETIDDWISELREIQDTVGKIAKETENKQKEMTRKQRDIKAKDIDWTVGQEVLLRNNVKIGRSKIQDQWHAKRWVITEILEPRTGLDRIRSCDEDDKEERIENRCNLRAAPKLKPFGVPAVDDPIAEHSPRRLRNRVVEDKGNKGNR